MIISTHNLFHRPMFFLYFVQEKVTHKALLPYLQHAVHSHNPSMSCLSCHYSALIILVGVHLQTGEQANPDCSLPWP
jgi:hypothetical protein